MEPKKGNALWKSGIMAGIATVVANLVLLFAIKPFVTAPAGFGPLSLAPVIMWSVVGTIGATLVFALVRRMSARPNRIFALIALAVLLLSFIPDVLIHRSTTGMFAGAGWDAIALLMAMHVVAAALIVSILISRTRPVGTY